MPCESKWEVTVLCGSKRSVAVLSESKWEAAVLCESKGEAAVPCQSKWEAALFCESKVEAAVVRRASGKPLFFVRACGMLLCSLRARLFSVYEHVGGYWHGILCSLS